MKKLGVGNVVPTWYGGSIARASLGVRTAQLTYYPPRWFSPLLSFVHFYVPWDRATLYQWIRYFDTWHAVVGACIDIHTMMPLSRFSLRGVHDPTILRVYEECCEELKAFLLMYSQLSEFWTIGEVFTLLYWDDKLGIFTDAEILMPEYIEIKSLPFMGSLDIEKNIYELVLDQFTLEMLETPDPDVQKMLMKLDPALLETIKKKGRLRLDGNLLMVMIKKRHMYQDRAQPILLRVMRELIYESKLLEAMYTIADRHVNPKEIWKIGNDNFPADQALLDAYEELIRNAEQQPLFTLVVPHTVSLDIVGATGKFPKLSDELDWVEKRILTALLLNKAVIHGEGPNFATASVAMRALMQRYMEVRAMLEEEWTTKVFLPIALKHNFFEITQAELEHGVRRPYKERKPILPYFDWHYKARLLDDSSFRDKIIELYKAGKIPLKILTDVLGLDYEYVKVYKEREEGTIVDPFYEEWRKEVIKKGLEGIVPAPKGVKGSVDEVDKKNLKEALEEADRKFEIFKKWLTKTSLKENGRRPVGEKEETDTDYEKKEKKVKKLLEETENIEFDWTTRGGLIRKLRIAEEIFKNGNLDLLTAILPREEEENKGG
jgi:hypothetical protein